MRETKKIFDVTDFLFWNSEYSGWWLTIILGIVMYYYSSYMPD